MPSTSGWKVGAKKCSGSWGTAESIGANDGLFITQESMPEGIPEPIKDEVVGLSLGNLPMQGNVKVEGGWSEPVRYEGFERRLALFCADDTVAVLTALQAWSHTMRFKPSNFGKFLTLAIDKGIGALGSNTWEYPSVKLSQLELTHDNGKLMANWSTLANKCERSAPVNDATEFGALTYPSPAPLAVFTALTFYLKEVTGSEGNTIAGDELSLSACSVTLNRNIGGDYVCGSKAGTIDEPDSNGLPSGQLKITFPQYTAAVDALIKNATVPTASRKPRVFKAKLVWQGPDIAGAAGNKYQFALYLPQLVVASAPANAGGPGAKVPVEMTFELSTPDTAGNGSEWTWATAGGDPAQFIINNKNSAVAA